jgi:hypothetical protein
VNNRTDKAVNSLEKALIFAYYLMVLVYSLQIYKEFRKLARKKDNIERDFLDEPSGKAERSTTLEMT